MGGQGESQDEDRKHLLWLCYNKASVFVVCSRSVDCRSIAIAQSSRHKDEDGSDGQACSSGPESHNSISHNDEDGQAASGPESQVNHARNPSSNDNPHGEIDKKIVGS